MFQQIVRLTKGEPPLGSLAQKLVDALLNEQ